MSGVSRTETVAVTGAGGLVGQGDPEGAGGEGGQGEVGGYGRAGGDDDAVAGGRRVAEGAGGQVVGAGSQGEGVAARRAGRRQAAAPVAVEGRGDGRAGDGAPSPERVTVPCTTPALIRAATAAKPSIRPQPESLLGRVVLSGTAVLVMRKAVRVMSTVGLTARRSAARPATWGSPWRCRS